MNAPALLVAMGRLDLTLSVDRDRLQVTGPCSAMTPDLEQAIRDHKAELVELVAADGWPEESIDAERRFGCWHARLYPLIGKTVATPRGTGRLVQVFPERASVILPEEAQVGGFLPEELGPPPVTSRGNHARPLQSGVVTDSQGHLKGCDHRSYGEPGRW